jgi:hypothetical protein
MFAIEPMPRALTAHGARVAPSTYYAAVSRPPSARAVRDGQPKTEISRVHKDNREVSAKSEGQISAAGQCVHLRVSTAHKIFGCRSAVRLSHRSHACSRSLIQAAASGDAEGRSSLATKHGNIQARTL